MTRNVLIAFGSPSDYEKFFDAGFTRLPGTNYYLSVASAHRTPEMVGRHARAMNYDGIIAGAGMCNALKDAYLKEGGDAVLVALPLSDSRTGGLSSILSSSEMPPGYPVAMSGIDDMSAAVNFVNYAIGGQFEAVTLSHDGETDSVKTFEDAAKMFDDLDVRTLRDGSDSALEVVAYCDPHALDSGRLQNAYAVASFASPFRGSEMLYNYMNILNASPYTVHTGIADGKNLALYAAKIIARHNPDVRERLERHIKDGRKKYLPFEELRSL